MSDIEVLVTITEPAVVVTEIIAGPPGPPGTGGGGGGTATLTPTTVKTTAYTAAVGENVLLDLRGGSFNVTLPTAPANGSQVGLRVRYRTPGSLYRAAFVPGGSDTTDSYGVSQYEEWEVATYNAGVWYSDNGFAPANMPLNRLDVPDDILSMGGFIIGGLGDATTSTDALNRRIGDVRYEQLADTQTTTIPADSPVTAVAGRRYTANLLLGNIVFNLPTGVADNSRIVISVSAVAGSNTATVNCTGTDRFQTLATGPTSKILNRVGQVLVVHYNSAFNVWLVEEDPQASIVSGYGTTPNTATQGDVGIDVQVDVQTYNTAGSYTWTKPSWATNTSTVRVWVMAAGGGGGSGRLGATSTIRGGGGGGASGNLANQMFLGQDVAATVTVTVGAEGTGGTGVSTADTNGNPGVAGGNSSFGRYLMASGGGGGAGGTATDGGIGGVASTTRGMYKGVSGGNGAGIAVATVGATAAMTDSNAMPSGGGGGGGGFTAANTNVAPAAGGGASAYTDGSVTGGVGSTGPGLGGGQGSAAQFNMGTGGGGGFRGNNANGTAGGFAGVGAGGGGGGGTTNTWVSGAGGLGGVGSVRVITTP